MRRLLLTALALGALPALAQTGEAPRTGEREVVIERDGAEPMLRRMIIVDGDTTIDERRGDIGEAQFFSRDGDIEIDRGGEGAPMRFRLRGERPGGFLHTPDGARGENVFRLRMQGDPGVVEFRGGDGPFLEMPPLMLRGMMGSGGVSDATRERMRTLEAEAHDLAREVRAAEGDARADAVRRLDAVLADLFEVRAEARREEAAHLRERADEMEAALRDRAARRQELIDARRAELLGTPAADW